MPAAGVLVCLGFAACAPTLTLPPHLGKPPAWNSPPLAEVDRHFAPRLDALTRSLAALDQSQAYFHAEQRQQNLRRTRDELLAELLRSFDAIERHVPRTRERQLRLALRLEEALEFAHGSWPRRRDGKVRSLEVFDKNREAIAFPLTRLIVGSLCASGGLGGLVGCVLTAGYGTGIVSVVIELPFFFLGSWWWVEKYDLSVYGVGENEAVAAAIEKRLVRATVSLTWRELERTATRRGRRPALTQLLKRSARLSLPCGGWSCAHDWDPTPVSGPLLVANGCKGKDLYLVGKYGQIVRITDLGIVEIAKKSVQSASGLAVGCDGAVYLSDPARHQVVSVHGAARRVVAGSAAGEKGFQDGPVARSRFDDPGAIAVDTSGAIYVADRGNRRIRLIRGGKVATIAGTGERGQRDGTPDQATFDSIADIALAGSSLVIADSGSKSVRQLFPAEGWIRTLLGNREGTGAASSTTPLKKPTALAVDPRGRLYVADAGRERVLRLRLDQTPIKVDLIFGEGAPGVDISRDLQAVRDAIHSMTWHTRKGRPGGLVYVGSSLRRSEILPP